MGKLIKELELADWFRQSILTVRRNRTAAPHRHPPYKKVGSSVLYDVDEVQRWLDAQTVNGPKTESVKNDSIKATIPKKDGRPGPGRPPKAETVRKSKNAEK
ncbi:hypothetical protein [Leptospirillum ferriphilum]|uniref:Uncharacterized protein n=1 Tax=Leptospirillum ferriphilum YSK TaxID=1441628 RepID=A0A059XNS0_9BACT|nr:hypothetical protein [Leptospirillum ferriphilum]AIA30174.1 hypothetical protein Y981_03495 [Leptospirillum ferriphilum YSK]